MTAKTGTPIATIPHTEVGPDFEVHEPEPGTLLVVCGECGFTFDSDHTVSGFKTVQMTADGMVWLTSDARYQCPWCLYKSHIEGCR